MSKSVSQFIKIGSKQLPIDIIFNKKGLNEYLYYSYRSNILNSAYYLSDIVKKSSYVGSFPNTETVKKPTITNYHYYKTKILGKDYFIAIEENTNKKFYLYAITNKLHKIKKWLPKQGPRI